MSIVSFLARLGILGEEEEIAKGYQDWNIWEGKLNPNGNRRGIIISHHYWEMQRNKSTSERNKQTNTELWAVFQSVICNELVGHKLGVHHYHRHYHPSSNHSPSSLWPVN
jgi:hypothetical protein